MNIFNVIGDFFLSAWLWNVTFDWVHIFLNFFILFLLLKSIMRETIIQSFLASLLAHLFAFLVFTVLFGFIIYMLDLDYVPKEFVDESSLINVMRANFSLASIFAAVQIGFFYFFRSLSGVRLLSYAVIICLSNGITAVLSFWLIRAFMRYSL